MLKMKKIGILTFHRAENFGATLQALAFQRYLSNLNVNVQIIDYRSRTIDSMYDLYNPKQLFRRKNFIMSIWNYLTTFSGKRQRKQLYHTFWNQHFQLSSPCKNADDVASLKYDVIFWGSDQIWNPFLTGGYDLIYWGSFTSNTTKKVAYAASSEKSAISNYDKNKKWIKETLNDFMQISCREEALAKQIATITGRNVQTVLDPTFLQKKVFYERIAIKPEIENYILIYHLTESDLAVELAESLSKNTGKEIIEIHVDFKYRKDKKRHKNNLGPAEVLGFILNAQYVLTTSFHGTALSLILQKQFIVVDEGNNERMKNLLQTLGLQGRIVKNNIDFSWNSIDYQFVEKKLETLLKSSKEFIDRALL